MQFWALRKLRIKEEKGFVTTQKNNLKRKNEIDGNRMLKYACVSHVTGAIGFNLCIKNVSKTNLVSKVSLPLPWSSAPGA